MFVFVDRIKGARTILELLLDANLPESTSQKTTQGFLDMGLSLQHILNAIDVFVCSVVVVCLSSRVS